MNKIINKIEEQIKQNNIIIYIKGTPQKPMCGFSSQVINILNTLEIEYAYVNILEHEEIRKNLPIYSNWPTFPQVYCKGKLIGGADIITQLYNDKNLKEILTE